LKACLEVSFKRLRLKATDRAVVWVKTLAVLDTALGLGRKRCIQYIDRVGLTRRLCETCPIRPDNALATPTHNELRKAIAPGGAAGLQTRLGTASVPGQVLLRLTFASLSKAEDRSFRQL
jgi:hypothetical protein